MSTNTINQLFASKRNKRCFLFFYLLAVICGIFSGVSYGQIGMQVPSPALNTINADSNIFSFPKPILSLRNWQDPTNELIEIEHNSSHINIMDYITDPFINDNPFNRDMRSSSLYVPKTVRDELNLIMNRPRDSAFLPVLPIAFLALQMASKYLLIQSKTRIRWEDIKQSEEGLPILEHLWKSSPQTTSQLYQHADLSEQYTMRTLQEMLNILIDNKLVRQKVLENEQTQYFPALNKESYKLIILEAKKNEAGRSEKSTIDAVPGQSSFE